MTDTKIDPATLLDALRGDKDGKVRDAAIACLKDKQGGVKRELDAGAAPDRYQTLSKVGDALVESQQVITAVWHHLHGAEQAKAGTNP